MREGALGSCPHPEQASLGLLWDWLAIQVVVDFSLCWLIAGRGHSFLGLHGRDMDRPAVLAKGWQFRCFILSGPVM